jgi:PAS domain S-box-containing protein
MGANQDQETKRMAASADGLPAQPPALDDAALPPELMLAPHLPVGVALYWPREDGADFELLYLNPAAARMLARPAQRLIGQRLSEVLPGAAAIGMLAALREAHRSGRPQRLEAARYQDAGVSLWLANRILRLDTGAYRGALVAIFTDESDLVRLRRDSLEQRHRFELVFENSLIGIFVVDRERRIIAINDCACAIFGHDRAALLGQSVERLHLSHASFQRFGDEVFSKIQSSGLIDVRYDLKRANGEIFRAALSGRPLNGVDRGDGVIWVVADISAMSRAEEALRASEERFALAVAGSNEGIWDWDLTTNRIYFSPRWKELIGHRDDEIPNRFEEWAARVHPDDLAAANAAIEAHLRGDTPMLNTEFRMRCKDGSWRWILGRGLCVRDEQGRPLRMAGSHSDVDDRRRAEDQARAKEAHLAAVINTVQTGIVVIDHEQRLVVEANELAARILGCPRDALIGSDCGGRLCLNPNACPFADESARPTDPITNQEAVFTRADGTQVDVLKSSAPLCLDGRKLLIESFVDISPIKETEQALRRAKEQAESAAIAKSEFLAKMSHEIRTPMNSILGMTKLTLDSELDTEQRENLDIVDASAESLLALIDNILDFSKLEARRVTMDPVDFDLSALFEEVRDGFAFRAAEKGLELIAVIDPQVPLGVRGDAQRLRQVLVNLLGNAIKFTAAGEVVLSVEPAPAPGVPPDVPPGDQRETPPWLRFAVRDTGVGVAAEKQADIFLAFQQADNSVTRHYGGSGLGLSISRQLVELMGGRIDLESTPEQGSVFWFEIPLPPARRPLEADGSGLIGRV